jgi:hypothetical protein
MRLFMLEPWPEGTGVVLISPVDLSRIHDEARAWAFLSRNVRSGDLIIGVHDVLDDFLIILRCDPQSTDFGYVFVTQEMYQRHEWVYAATSLGEFLERYIDARGEEFWQDHGYGPVLS